MLFGVGISRRAQVMLNPLNYVIMAKCKINYDEVILFKKSDFPLLRHIDDYEKDMDVWYQNSDEDFYMVDNMLTSPEYRTYLMNKFSENKWKDVKCYNAAILFARSNEGKIDFNIGDYYVFYGVEYLY